MFSKPVAFARFVRFVLHRWVDDRCPQIAGSLAFTTLLAMVPVFAIAVAVLSWSPFFESVMAQIKIFLLLNLLPEIAGRIITVYMVEFEHNAARLTWIGLAALFVMSVSLMLTFDRSLNHIWRSHRKRPMWALVAGYFMLLVLGPLLIGTSVTVTTYLMGLSAGILPTQSAWQPLALHVVPTLSTGLLFFLVYKIVPHEPVPSRHALAGAAVAALLFEASKELFAFYVEHAPAYSVVYGTFVAFPFFLLWVYLSWLVVLFGAELTASLAQWKDGRPVLRKEIRGRARIARSSR
jgi:membrane protein